MQITSNNQKLVLILQQKRSVKFAFANIVCEVFGKY